MEDKREIIFIANTSLIDIFDNVLYNNIQTKLEEKSVLPITLPFKDLFTIDEDYIPYIHGMQVKCIVEVYPIYRKEDISIEDIITTYEPLLQLTTNNIPITLEMYNNILYSYKVGESINDKINTIEQDMDKINIVNKTVVENIITTVEGEGANITMKPVFFRYQDSTNITIYKEVVDRISINLDAYKSKVDTFFLLIDGKYYMEIGRNIGGVIFSVTGGELTSSPISGNYFITDSDFNVVTKGKYNIL